MSLGIFDSGLGGILIAKALHDAFPELDKIYLGDTMNLPYGNRSEETIYTVTKNCIAALFDKGCQVIIVACNTASSRALRRLQQEYLPIYYPERRILGVVVPTIEEALGKKYQKLGVIGTNYTIGSGIYESELQKLNPDLHIEQRATPLLVPLIENNGEKYLDDVLSDYLSFMDTQDFDALLLGCTHYIHLKDRLRQNYDFDVLSQDEVVPKKLKLYFENHDDLFNLISKNGSIEFFATDLTENYADNASALFGQKIDLKLLEGIHSHA